MTNQHPPAQPPPQIPRGRPAATSTTAPPSSSPPAGAETTSSSAESAIIQPNKAPGQASNRVFTGLSFDAGTFIMVVLTLVAAFLIREVLSALTASRETLGSVFFMRDRSLRGYVTLLVSGTLLSSTIALDVAVPLSIGVALLISHFAPRRPAQASGYMMGLLAVIPSMVFGLWGFLWPVPLLDPLNTWLSEHLGFTPSFADYTTSAKNITTASLIPAVMILPVITATIRKIPLQTPTLQEEASLALGATHYKMIHQAVLPLDRSGIISVSMLGPGRALGGTMVALVVLSPGMGLNLHVLQADQHQAIAANIAPQFREAYRLSVSVLIATDLVLFIITFTVNSLARRIIVRRSEFSGAS